MSGNRAGLISFKFQLATGSNIATCREALSATKFIGLNRIRDLRAT